MIRTMFVLVGAGALLLGAERPEQPTPDRAATTIDLSAERATITGRVIDAVSRQPLAGAQVSVEGTGVGGLANNAGRYMLLNVPGEIGTQVTVTVTLIGHSAGSKTITLAETNTVDFELREQALALEGVVVTGTAGQARRREVGNTVASVGTRDVDGRNQAGPTRAEEARRSAESAAQGAVPPPPVNEDRIAPVGDVERQARLQFQGRYDDIRKAMYASVTGESYAQIEENGFIAVENEPLSTFSIDVDRASYANVRRMINDGVRPPVDAVRIEELVNYFTYSDPAPRMDDDVPLFINTEVAPAPWQPLHNLVRVGLKGREIDLDAAPASNLVFLLDVSGSMNTYDKLPLLKTALSMLVAELRPEDRVAIVVYAGAAGLVLPSTSGADKDTILESLRALRAGGSTAGGAGIRLAYSVAQENFIEGGNNRVILATDGDFNVGASSDAEMVRLIEEKRESDVFLTVLGFGTGNLQDSKMEQIADHGNGNFAYIDSEMEAKKVLVNEMGGTMYAIAQDVKIQIEFNPAQVAAYRLIGYENRLLAAEDFNDDTKDAGELGAGHSVTALYEVVPVGVDSPVTRGTVDPLRYQRNPAQGDNLVESQEMLFVKLRYQEPGGSPSKLVTRPVDRIELDTSEDWRFAAAVAAWGMLLRDSEHCPDFTLADVSRLARGAVGDDPQGYRAEFLQLVDRARSMELLNATPGSYVGN